MKLSAWQRGRCDYVIEAVTVCDSHAGRIAPGTLAESEQRK